MSHFSPQAPALSLTRPMVITLVLMLSSIAAAVASPEVEGMPEAAHCAGPHPEAAQCANQAGELSYLYWHQGSSRVVPACSVAVPG